jgi:hypothetical protein
MSPGPTLAELAPLTAFALLGALLGGLYAYAVLRWSPSPARTFAVGLIVAAAVYPAFALSARVPGPWLTIELAGLVLFTALALPALLRAPAGSTALTALAAGWALHPLWDVLLHASAIGALPDAPGAGYVPSWYPPTCATFDWAVALACAAFARRPRLYAGTTTN